MARRRQPHRPLNLDSSHWREDGQPKQRYPTERIARDAAQERSQEAGVELNVYRCAFCNGWHMGKRGGRAAELP